jgi:protocatechuate 3,4-dioxygenase, beta subunit
MRWRLMTRRRFSGPIAPLQETAMHNTLRRRLSTALIAAPALVLPRWVNAQTSQPRMLTPAQTEGPFYPDELPADHDGDLLAFGNLSYTKGQVTKLTGTVSDAQGRALRGAVVDIWQCDHQGHYRHPRDGGGVDAAFQGFGRVSTDADGRYRFRAIRPTPYTGRTPHIHVKVALGGRELLTTQLYVQGEAGNARDGIYRSLNDAQRAALTVPFVQGAEGFNAAFAIVVAA